MTWALLTTETESSGGFTLTNRVYKRSTGVYYQVKVEREVTMSYGLQTLKLGSEVAIAAGTTANPARITWSVVETSTETVGDLTITRETIMGTPESYDPGPPESYSPIGSLRFYREQITTRYQGAPRPQAKISLTWA